MHEHFNWDLSKRRFSDQRLQIFLICQLKTFIFHMFSVASRFLSKDKLRWDLRYLSLFEQNLKNINFIPRIYVCVEYWKNVRAEKNVCIINFKWTQYMCNWKIMKREILFNPPASTPCWDYLFWFQKLLEKRERLR